MITGPPFDRPFTLAEAAQRGLTRAQVRSWLERGQIQRLGHGLYAPKTIASDQVRPSRAVADGRLATSMVGAASVHGLLLPPAPHVSMQVQSRPERIPQTHRYRLGKVLLSGTAWTAVSLARYQPLYCALVPLDSALRLGVSRADLQALSLEMRGWPGTTALPQAIEAADARSESALESLTRGRCIAANLPAPDLQHEVVINRSRYRLDFYWPQRQLALEVDGLAKYTERGDILAEKRRHNALQGAGITVIRCGYTNVHPNADVLMQQLRTLLS